MPRQLRLRHLLTMAVALSLLGAALADPLTPLAADSPGNHSTESLARRALKHNGESTKAVAELRSIGPEGLRAFLEANRK